MKITKKLLAAGITALFCCSIGNAQIIYSNDFTVGAAVNITNTPPTLASSFAGGTNTAVWINTMGTNDTGNLLANGVINTTLNGDSWILPFVPQSNYIYLITATVSFTNNPGNWVGFGFAKTYTNNFSVSASRFTDTDSGYDWLIMAESTGNVQYFGGAGTANGIVSANNLFPPGPGTNTAQILLNTKVIPWTTAAFVNGIQMGSSFTYAAASNPSNLIHAVGITQNIMTAPNAVQIQNFSLVATLQPFITIQPIAATTIGGGTAYTNSVTVTADTNGGALSYQWYANNLPLTNGVNNISGANSNRLIINPVATINQLTNYYVIVSNLYGSATSTLASLTVLTNPVIAAPVTSPTAITLFAGSVGKVGSSPTFSVTAIGAPPLTYQWQTNGVAVSGATKSSISFTNTQPSSPATYACVVSNGFGTTNSTWSATYVATPTAAYPQAVLGDTPINLWRLNETDDGNGNIGAVAHDYQSGNNGVYENVTLGQTGYDGLEGTETSMLVTANATPSAANAIGNLDLAATMTNGVNAQFAVEAWANCLAANGPTGGAPVVAQGAFGASSWFLGVNTNSPKHYQFYVRNAAGTLVSADDTAFAANDLLWHHLVGVCDEAHTNISLYIDGRLAASTSIATNSGNFESGFPIAIGAGIRPGAATTNVPFTGNIDDVAIYSHALSIGQVINHYTTVGGTVAVAFVPPLVPTNFVYLANQTLSIPATIAGSAPLGFYWTNVTTGGVISSGSTTNSGTLDATLTIPNAFASLSGDLLQLVVTNSISSTNKFVTLFSPAAPVVLDSSNPILYSNLFNGGTWSIAGMPLTAENILVGGTNTTWTDSLGTNDNGKMMGNGFPSTLQQESWLLPFTPHAGYVYTINSSLTFFGNPGTVVGPGFATSLVTNVVDGRFNGNVTGYDWMILTESSSNLQYFAGPAATVSIIASNAFFTPNVGTHTMQTILDTTGTNWKAYGSVDGRATPTNTYATKPPIGAVGFNQNTLTVPTNIQWNYFALTQVAPGGVPPYLLNPLPPTNNILLTNGTVTLPATAFGSAPFGYSWINNATVIASGSTNAMAPLTAGLSVPSTSLSAGQLQLVVTNAFGTNITLITLVSPVNPNPGRIQFSVSGNQLTLSWPTNLGWTLQTQTNNSSVGLKTNWVNVANSTTTNQTVVPLNTTNGDVFYRLSLP